MVLYRSSAPHLAVLGGLPERRTYRNVKRFKKAVVTPEALVIRFDDQLYFANTAYFKETIRDLVRQKGEELEVVIVEAKSIHDIDSSGMHTLEEVYDYLKRKDIEFYLTGVIGPVRDALFRSGLMKKIGNNKQFLSVYAAMQYHQTKNDTSVETEGWSEAALQTNFEEE